MTQITELYDAKNEGDEVLKTNYDEENSVTWDNCLMCDVVTMCVDATDFPEYLTELRYAERVELGINELDQFIEDASVAHVREAHPEIDLEN